MAILALYTIFLSSLLNLRVRIGEKKKKKGRLGLNAAKLKSIYRETLEDGTMCSCILAERSCFHPDCVMCFEDEDDGYYNAVGLYVMNIMYVETCNLCILSIYLLNLMDRLCVLAVCILFFSFIESMCNELL